MNSNRLYRRDSKKANILGTILKLFTFILSLFIFTTVQAEPVLIGTPLYNPPFNVAADKKGNFFGFDIDITMEACRRIEAECRFVPLTFSQIFVDLLSGKINLGIGSISITDLRMQSFLFTLPYMASTGQYVTNQSSNLNTREALQQKKVGALQGSLFKALILEQFPNNVQILEYPTHQDLFNALSNKKVDAIITDEESAQYWTATNSALFKLLGDPITVGVGYGIMANKNEQGLVNRLNKALVDMETDGTYLKIYQRYFNH